MKRKLFGLMAAAFAVVIMAASLAACSSGNKKAETTAAETTEAAAAETTKEETTKETTKEAAKETTKETTKSTTKEETTKETAKTEKETETKAEAKDDSSQNNGGFAVEAMDGSMFCMAEGGVNVRAGYSTNDNIFTTLRYGDKIQITGKVTKDGADYGWYQIDYNGQKAYVSADYFSVKQPAAETAPAPAAGLAPAADEFEQLCREITLQTAGDGSTIVSTELRHDGIGDWLQGDYYYIGVQDAAGNITYYYARTDWALTQAEVDAMN